MKDPLGRRHGGLHDRVLRTEIAHGDKKSVDIFLEGHQGSNADDPVQNLSTSIPEQESHAHGSGRFHHRVEACLIEVG